MKNALEIIQSLSILEDDFVVLACSYGPDSMCLLDILKKENLNIVVAHVNHKFRKESDKEYLDLKRYCDENNIIFEGIEINEKSQGNMEEFFRSFRYNFFKNIVNKYKAKYLFTAHHGDDLVETILMRLTRGSSFRGYAGFKAITKRDDYVIVRPLIYFTKDDIFEYVNENKIPYAIDQTNLGNDYTRNRYRNEILPILKDINPKVHEKFIKFSYTINEYNDYLDNEVNNLYSNLYINNRLDLNEFEVLPLFLKKNLLRKILFEKYGSNISVISDVHLNLIFNLISSPKVNGSVNLPKSIVVSKYYNILEFRENNLNVKEYDYIFNNYLDIGSGSYIEKINKTDIIKSNYLIRLCSNDITLPLHIRSRKYGDKIFLKNGTKKVGEILSESKMPKFKRDSYPIVTDDKGNILWIPGVKKSKFDRQVTEEYDIILKYVKKGEDYEE